MYYKDICEIVYQRPYKTEMLKILNKHRIEISV